MLKRFAQFTILLMGLSLGFVAILPASAQGAQYDLSSLTAANSGSLGNVSNKTGLGPEGYTALMSNLTGHQNSVLTLPVTGLGGLAPVFGMTGYGSYGNNSVTPTAYTTTSQVNLANMSAILPGSTFAQNHPRQTEVLVEDSNLYNQIITNQASLGSNYNQLANQALAIENQDVTEAAGNGGYITASQQAQLNQEETSLAQQISSF